MELDRENEAYSWFWFGMAVIAEVHDIPRTMAMWDKVEACLKEIADGELTLADSPEEAKRQLPQMSEEDKAMYEATYGMSLDDMLRKRIRQGMKEHKERAAVMLARMKKSKQE